MKAPCQNCENRTPTCHAACDKYKSYAEYRKEFLEKKRKYYDAENTYIAHVIGTINRNNNRRKEAGKE